MIKHVSWKHAGMGGVCGVAVLSDDRLIVECLNGCDLPVTILVPVLDATLGEDWKKKAENLHQKRKHPWRVESRTGMSGVKDYYLRVLVNEKWKYAPVMAHLHVSMNGKLNEGVDLWLGDVPPLLDRVVQYYGIEKPEKVRVRTPEEIHDGDFEQPSAPSGLLETVESIKALEALGGSDDNA